jgi:malonate-semialdehyde dehydrogenase (acetylating)/methylmalonate-semialdehyde dehydrogenase
MPGQKNKAPAASGNGSAKKQKTSGPQTLSNYINDVEVAPANGKYLDCINPGDDSVLCKVPLSTEPDIQKAVDAARKAQVAWAAKTVMQRAAVMMRFHELVVANCDELTQLCVDENGKNWKEAVAEVAKGNETVAWACGMPHLMQGNYLRVSRGVTCRSVKDPVGVVACIVPFNFPFMVPMWTVPISLVAGNAVILKPSEQCPLSMAKTAELLTEAGLPAGLFQIVHGAVDSVNALCDNSGIDALTFVGSSKVARIVKHRCSKNDKKCIALGGAKNHLVSMDDCDVEMASNDIVASFSGCAGQRCMAAPVLLTVGEQPKLVDAIVKKASNLKKGQKQGQVGAVINPASKKRILGYIDDAEKSGAKILVDGRSWGKEKGNWVGPTVILHTNRKDKALHEEIFGPVISILVVKDPQDAIAFENANPHGNAASIYTSCGGNAQWFTDRFQAAMLGVNIGVPVPREPFSFGGLEGSKSKYGEADITGEGCMNFVTKLRKITQKWNVHPAVKAEKVEEDKASFVGTM